MKKNKMLAFVLIALMAGLTLVLTGAYMLNQLNGSGKIDVGGFSLFATAAGKGKPVVVMDAGYGDDSTAWSAVMNLLSPYTTVFAYDRAGLGQSDPSNRPRTSVEQAEQLHTLLQNAHLPGPYILVGHSLGGITMRVFAAKYPKDVIGLVLVDASHEEQNKRILEMLPPEMWEMYMQEFGAEGTYQEVEQSMAQAAACKSAIRNLPLYVISAGDHGGGPELETMWAQMQKELVALSRKSEQFFALNDPHNVHKTNPAFVADVIKKMIDRVSNN